MEINVKGTFKLSDKELPFSCAIMGCLENPIDSLELNLIAHAISISIIDNARHQIIPKEYENKQFVYVKDISVFFKEDNKEDFKEIYKINELNIPVNPNKNEK